MNSDPHLLQDRIGTESCAARRSIFFPKPFPQSIVNCYPTSGSASHEVAARAITIARIAVQYSFSSTLFSILISCVDSPDLVHPLFPSRSLLRTQTFHSEESRSHY